MKKRIILVVLILTICFTGCKNTDKLNNGIYYNHLNQPISISNDEFHDYSNGLNGYYSINDNYILFEYNRGDDTKAWFDIYKFINQKAFYRENCRLTQQFGQKSTSRKFIMNYRISRDGNQATIFLELFSDGTFREDIQNGEIVIEGKYKLKKDKILFYIDNEYSYYYYIDNGVIYPLVFDLDHQILPVF